MTFKVGDIVRVKPEMLPGLVAGSIDRYSGYFRVLSAAVRLSHASARPVLRSIEDSHHVIELREELLELAPNGLDEILRLVP